MLMSFHKTPVETFDLEFYIVVKYSEDSKKQNYLYKFLNVLNCSKNNKTRLTKCYCLKF